MNHAAPIAARLLDQQEICTTRRAARQAKRLPFWLKAVLGLSVVPASLTAAPGLAAERIILTYGSLQRSIAVESIETYAREGEIEGNLGVYTGFLNDQQLAQLRQVLNAQVELSPVAISQFLYTEQGEILLRRLGEVIRTESNLSGFYAIRAALILAADDPEGLTPLNVLQKFPLEGIRIDLARVLQDLSAIETLIRQTQDAVTAIVQQSEAEAAQSNINLAQLPNLQRRGTYAWRKDTFELRDTERRRTFPVDLYLPILYNPTPEPPTFPVVVISHGLGSDRQSFAYFAQHLASYGFAVAVPEHPGSNAQQLQALISGRANEVTAPDEFIDRPLDIKFLLDTLQQYTAENPELFGRLNLQEVGVIGQSFGGYTALALAGAGINFQQLRTDCPPSDTFNLSLLLQCRAIELAPTAIDLRDPRVKAIIAINPIGSSILGETDFQAIDIPTMIITSSADTVAPALPEQIRPFTWLNTPDKYLLLLEGGTHFSTIAASDPESEAVPIPQQVIGPDPELAQRYLNTLGTAFFITYIGDQPEYQAYLNAAYVKSISQSPLPVSLVRSLAPSQLAQALQAKLPEPESEATFTPQISP
jgi:predicted dienelactone hydrolase